MIDISNSSRLGTTREPTYAIASSEEINQWLGGKIAFTSTIEEISGYWIGDELSPFAVCCELASD
jgi:hypothetical protein